LKKKNLLRKNMKTIEFPVKIIKGEKWIFLTPFVPKAKIRAIGMDNKSKRIQDTGKHHCFEINAQGNIRIIPKKWK